MDIGIFIGEISDEVLYIVNLNPMYLPHVNCTIYSSHFITYKQPSLTPKTDHQSPDLQNIIKRCRLGGIFAKEANEIMSYHIQPIVDRKSCGRGCSVCEF